VGHGQRRLDTLGQRPEGETLASEGSLLFFLSIGRVEERPLGAGLLGAG